MKFILTKHFYERLVERWGSMELVEDIINNPNKIEKQEEWKVKYLKFDWEKYIHIVVAKNKNNEYVLITYYKTSKSKYLS